MGFVLQKNNHPCWGLTGGIGSGKSTVARIWQAQQNIHLIDTDAMARALTSANGAAIDAIRAEFGAGFIDSQTNALDRARMRELAFTEPAARKRLEAIIHPLIYQQIQEQVALSAARQCQAALLDIPLLTESAFWRKNLDAVVVVDCTRETQIRRVQMRNQLSVETIRNIIASQASRAQRLAIADVVIANDATSLDELPRLVRCAAGCLAS